MFLQKSLPVFLLAACASCNSVLAREYADNDSTESYVDLAKNYVRQCGHTMWSEAEKNLAGAYDWTSEKGKSGTDFVRNKGTEGMQFLGEKASAATEFSKGCATEIADCATKTAESIWNSPPVAPVKYAVEGYTNMTFDQYPDHLKTEDGQRFSWAGLGLFSVQTVVLGGAILYSGAKIKGHFDYVKVLEKDLLVHKAKEESFQKALEIINKSCISTQEKETFLSCAKNVDAILLKGQNRVPQKMSEEVRSSLYS